MSDVLTDSPEHLRLGIDLDGVVADFNQRWIARRVAAYDRPLPGATDVHTWDAFRDPVATVAARRRPGR
jgi:5'(3')-deoxyribonucleotidase